MKLQILTPEQTVYTGDVKGVQLPGIDGSFELLDNHAPMVAALDKGKMKILVSANDQTNYKITGGFVQTAHNTTTILLEGISDAL